ncbi:MAG: SAV_915 family protein, partial [Sciscionella sp.]
MSAAHTTGGDVGPEHGQLVYVAARPVHDPDLAPYGVEVRRLQDGAYGWMVFTPLDRLVDVLGMYQPWVGVRAGELAGYLDALGVARLYVDSGMPEDAWRWQPEQL